MALSDNKYAVRSVKRAFEILEALRDDRELRLIDISRKLGIPKGMVFKLLETLGSLGYVKKNQDTGRYRLGIRLFELGSSALSYIKEREELHSILQALVDETNETAHFAVLQGGEVLYLDKVESRASLRMVTAIGLRRPAYCTGTGKALLAWQPEDFVRRIMNGSVTRFTPNTITDVDSLLKELALVRERGYAVDNEENEPGIICIGTPVRNHEGSVVAAISLAGPSIRIGPEIVPVLAKRVIETAQVIRDRLGYIL
ncbi:MAG TPA: IclR family transcriptional regulator [Firmicutes bacterium]|nr:IclR family transcriptional regulator [Bacillota bacterium]